ncbi:MAG: hypothetical protein ACTSVW_07385 [Candidatus Njordarchaeales archaeon]
MSVVGINIDENHPDLIPFWRCTFLSVNDPCSQDYDEHRTRMAGIIVAKNN